MLLEAAIAVTLTLSAQVGYEPLPIRAEATTTGPVYETCIEVQQDEASGDVEITSCWEITEKTPSIMRRLYKLEKGEYQARLVYRIDPKNKEGNANWRVTPWQQIRVLESEACEQFRQREHKRCF